MTLSNKQVIELANNINAANDAKTKANSQGISYKNLFMHDYMQKFFSNDVEGLKFYRENIVKDKPLEKQKAIVSQAKTAIRVIASQQQYEIASLPNRILTKNDVLDNDKPIAIYSQLVKVAKELKLDSASVKQKNKLEHEREKFIKESILSANPAASTVSELKDLNEAAYTQAYDLAKLQWDELQAKKEKEQAQSESQALAHKAATMLEELYSLDITAYEDIFLAMSEKLKTETKAA